MVRRHCTTKLFCTQQGQYDGLAMGASSSGLIAVTFLQHIEHIHVGNLTHKHRIINYCRCVDDILLIFDSNHTNIQMILDDFNSLHPNYNSQQKQKEITLCAILISPYTEPPQTFKPQYTGSPHTRTLSSSTPPTTPHTTNTQQSGFYSTD